MINKNHVGVQGATAALCVFLCQGMSREVTATECSPAAAALAETSTQIGESKGTGLQLLFLEIRIYEADSRWWQPKRLSEGVKCFDK